VNDLAWTDDSKKIMAVGAGQQRAMAINLDTKSKAGDLICHSATLLTCDIKNPKPYKAIVSGEDKEVQFYAGVPFKHAKSVKTPHSGFVTKCAFNPWDEGATFITVSADKTLNVFNSETYEKTMQKEGLHTMGVTDMDFGNQPGQLFTCSSDRQIKKWKLSEAALDEEGSMTHSERD
jgi:WD40 repeat protein